MSGISFQVYTHASSIGQLVFSPATLEELKEVLSRSKFDKYLSADARQEALASIVDLAFVTTAPEETDIYCRDEKDIKFLQVAFAAEVSCLVTGDSDLLVLHPFRGIPIMKGPDFLQMY